ncbi:MAG: O-antigen ligase family protein [Luteibaculaceae bacterium]
MASITQSGAFTKTQVALAALFPLLASLCWVFYSGWVFLFLPLVFLLLYLAFYHQLILFYALLFLVPLSINFEEMSEANLGLSMPTEPILFMLTLVFLGKLVLQSGVAKRLFAFPVVSLLLLYLAWIFVSAIQAEYPLASIKYGVAQTWFIIPAFLGGLYYLDTFRKQLTAFGLFALGLSIVVVSTVVEHSWYGFTQNSAHWVPGPFFKDHTSYGAALVLVFPFFFLILAKLKQLPSFWLIPAVAGFLIFSVGLVFSYTRAAWISAAAALIFVALVYVGLQLRHFMLIALSLLSLAYVFEEDIILKLRQIRHDSSTEFASHLKSVANISTDHSNLERINRWTAAVDMGLERPIFGFGAGNYQFTYAPYQHAENLTPISTNFGTLGNAHSEYLGRFAEQGFLGLAIFVALMLVLLNHGIKAVQTTKENQWFYLALLAGIFSYMLHAFLNNFLDQDKIAVPFWLMAAILVGLSKRNAE